MEEEEPAVQPLASLTADASSGNSQQESILYDDASSVGSPGVTQVQLAGSGIGGGRRTAEKYD